VGRFRGTLFLIPGNFPLGKLYYWGEGVYQITDPFPFFIGWEPGLIPPWAHLGVFGAPWVFSRALFNLGGV